MTDIGLELKQKREENGVSIEEAASDLNISPLTIENLEDGNKSFFNDVLELKELIINYSKYLGLDENKMETEFNEFMFEYTSKIPIKEIEQAIENNSVKEEKVTSPYTSSVKDNNKKKIIFIVLGILSILAIIGIIAIKLSDSYNEDNIYVLRR